MEYSTVVIFLEVGVCNGNFALANCSSVTSTAILPFIIHPPPSQLLCHPSKYLQSFTPFFHWVLFIDHFILG
jgi:hypothetical protein